MFKSLLKNAFRNITHKFGYSFLNILGMTLGITSALFLILYVSDELSFDRYHEKGDRIFRVQSHITEPDDEFTWIFVQIPFAPQVKEDYAEVETYTRLFNFQRALFIHGETKFTEEDVFYADSTFFDVFSYRSLEGSHSIGYFQGPLPKGPDHNSVHHLGPGSLVPDVKLAG